MDEDSQRTTPLPPDDQPPPQPWERQPGETDGQWATFPEVKPAAGPAAA